MFRIIEGEVWVGDRQVDGNIVIGLDVERFRAGFALHLPNGWTLSTQWGNRNYCQNRDATNVCCGPKPAFNVECVDAEVAIVRSGRYFRWVDGQEVNGWIDPTTWWDEILPLAHAQGALP